MDHSTRNIRYVGVSSGNVSKTMNRNVSWETVFDDCGSYSIGAVTADST